MTKTNQQNDPGSSNRLHPFEQSGLGLAPFRYLRHERKVGPIQLGCGSQVGSPGQPMGVCEHCGTGIADCYYCKSADGKVFYVGCDCIEKLYKSSNRTSSQLARDPFYQAFKAEKNRIATERRHELESAKITEGGVWASENEAKLRAIADPNRKSQSLWDRYQWFTKNAGNAGKIKVVKELRTIADATTVDSDAIILAAKKSAAKAICDGLRLSDREYGRHRRIERFARENAWLIEVLQATHGDFAASMADKLIEGPVTGLSDRCIEIIRDIYAKSHGRRSSRKYDAACEEFQTQIGVDSIA